MAWTIDDYNNLQKAIATGAREVQHAGKKVVYKDTSEMRETLAIMGAELGLSKKRSRKLVIIQSKGLYNERFR